MIVRAHASPLNSTEPKNGELVFHTPVCTAPLYIYMQGRLQKLRGAQWPRGLCFVVGGGHDGCMGKLASSMLWHFMVVVSLQAVDLPVDSRNNRWHRFVIWRLREVQLLGSCLVPMELTTFPLSWSRCWLCLLGVQGGRWGGPGASRLKERCCGSDQSQSGRFSPPWCIQKDQVWRSYG